MDSHPHVSLYGCYFVGLEAIYQHIPVLVKRLEVEYPQLSDQTGQAGLYAENDC